MEGLKLTCLLLAAFLIWGCFSPMKTAGQAHDSSEEKLLRIVSIGIQGNEKTRKHFILQELTFAAGDYLTISELDDKLHQSLINLVNTSLFLNHLIRIDYFYISNHDLCVNISLVERWYLWPEPILQNAQRNFNTWLQDRKLQNLNYGINLIRDNFMGKAQRITFVLQTGFDQKFGITFSSPPKKKFGYGFGASYHANREVAYKVSQDQLVFLRTEQSVFTHRQFFVQALYRPAIHYFHQLSMQVNVFNFSDTLMQLNPQFASGVAGGKMLPEISYQFKADYRDHKAYPLEGSYFDIDAAMINLDGKGFFSSGKTTLKSNFRKYFKLNPSWFYAIGITGKTSSGQKQPFMLEKGLGYGREFVRGYEYNVIHGQHFILLKHNIKRTLFAPYAFHIPFMPIEKFEEAWFAIYLNVFMDAGFVSRESSIDNMLPGRWMGSVGLGVDMVTYYDKVIRLEMAVNGLYRTGLYLHFIAPI